MPETELRLLDRETIQDPDLLLTVIDDLLASREALTQALMTTVCLLLAHLRALPAPDQDASVAMVHRLKYFLANAVDDLEGQAKANAMSEFLDQPE